MALPDSISERRKLAAQVRREVLGDTYVNTGQTMADPFYQNFLDFTVDNAWSAVWLRDGLPRKTRSMLNLAMLSVMGRWHEFDVHTRGALNNGVTEQEIAEVLVQAGAYGGVPVAAEAFRRARATIKEWKDAQGKK